MPFGDAQARFRQIPTSGSAHSLRVLAGLVRARFTSPVVRRAALAIRSSCDSRDDACELQAIYDAVKPPDLGGSGNSRVPGLERGVPYVADPDFTVDDAGAATTVDFYVAPDRLLQECEGGSCGGDCDDHAMLVAALAGSIGFTVGLRIWGPAGGKDFVHIYGVAALPKRKPSSGKFERVVGLDTTVSHAYVGWEPPNGRFKTAWIL